MTKWDYDHAYIDVGEDAEFDDVAEDRGSQGWELISVIEQDDDDSAKGAKHLHLFFKRPRVVIR